MEPPRRRRAHRQVHPRQQALRGRADSGWINPTERDYNIVDTLIDVSEKIGATPAQVALKWVQDRPGVTSTIIGARTLEQLDANLAALDVEIPAEHTAALDEVSAQPQAFPFDFLKNAKTVVQNGSTVNGEHRDAWPLSPRSDDERH
ncbi:MAG: aldo/keto reductase [Phycisphaerales bacterium]|nr:aldo/keto reductase [Phycisphaerales bacterium]